MISQWLESYAKWDAGNQLVFSCVVLISTVVLLVLFGMWVRSLVDVFTAPRPKPPEDHEEEIKRLLLATKSSGWALMPRTILDWKVEAARQQEEAEFQRQLQEKAQDEMEQTELARQLAQDPKGDKACKDSTS